jgi:hypothetical protein
MGVLVIPPSTLLRGERILKTKEEVSLKNRLYHAANREKISRRKRQWALDNPEKVNKHQRDNPEYHNEYIKAYRRKHPDKFAAYSRKQNYGVTQTWFEDKLKEQAGKCAVCFEVMVKPNVDHNHETNKARGLLCHPCNVMLGYAHEDSVRLANAIQYLAKYEDTNG